MLKPSFLPSFSTDNFFGFGITTMAADNIAPAPHADPPVDAVAAQIESLAIENDAPANSTAANNANSNNSDEEFE
jgi:hypothetical protein